MLKQGLLYFIASLLLVVLSRYVHACMTQLSRFYVYMDHVLRPFSGHIGLDPLVHQVMLLVLIPLLLVGVPAGVYWLIKRQPMPYFVQSTWCMWLVLVLSIVLH